MVGSTTPSQAPSHPRPIRVLPPLLVNQIAAGEVVERPASVVKELLDNAIDAGARRVVIELEHGGIERIRISDDGHGIEPDQLPLAVQQHATSKIASAADLDAISTMGFRGEALASIASVSRLEIQSRRRPAPGQPADRASDGHALLVEGGKAHPVRPAGCPVGTTVDVRTLFYNTPARRKFLKAPATEQQHCLEMIRNLAIAHPAIGFRVLCDGREVLDLPSDQSPRQRVLAVLGPEHEPELIEVSADHFDDARGLTLWGMIGTPVLAKQGNRHQRVFVNGRPIRDKTIIHALKEAYRSLIEPSRHPLAVLMLEMSPAGVDVNVHPTKTEVRFRDTSMVHQAVYRAAKSALATRDLTPTDAGFHASRGFRFRPVQAPPPAGDAPLPWASNGAHAHSQANNAADSTAQRLAAFLRTPPPPPVSPAPSTVSPHHAGPYPPALFDGATRTGTSSAIDAPAVSIAPGGTAPGAPGGPGGPGTPGVDVEAAVPAPAGHAPADGQATSAGASTAIGGARVLQVHDAFLITQDEDGVVIVDQHALHERVLYEAIHRRLAEGPLESQQLLTPVMVGVSPAAVDELLGRRGVLERFGIDLTQAGPTTLALHAFPTLLFDRRVDPAVFIAELAEKLDADGTLCAAASDAADPMAAGEELLQDVVAMMACKAAVKAGDRLSEGELLELLRLREVFERSSNCPHGRPTAIRLSIRELERQFGRLG
jgi:DNA mismatch repair protein MutL